MCSAQLLHTLLGFVQYIHGGNVAAAHLCLGVLDLEACKEIHVHL